jgi:hypothetical protein
VRYLSLILLAVAPLAGQNISVGVRGGVPLTDLVDAVKTQTVGFQSERKNYVVGPTFEVRIPWGLGFHVDALYRKMTITGTASDGSSATDSFGFWQFPVMVKKRFGAGPFRPYVNAGPSFSKLTGVSSLGGCAISVGSNGCLGTVLKSSGTGFAVGGGLDLRIPVIRVAPEIRYTRLGAGYFQGEPNATLESQRNQLEFLVGITF